MKTTTATESKIVTPTVGCGSVQKKKWKLVTSKLTDTKSLWSILPIDLPDIQSNPATGIFTSG